jgi:hypothetical protein
MPDSISGLYPQPPQQQPQGSSLLSNPGQAVGIMQGLQNLNIQSQQAPALVQQPQAALGIAQRELASRNAEYQFKMRQLYSGWMGNYLTTLDHNPTNDEIHNETANAVRAFGGAGADIADQTAQDILGQKDRRKFGNILNSRALPPEAAAQRVQGPYDRGTGAGTMEPLGTATARGASPVAPGPDVERSTTQYYNDANLAKDYQNQSQALTQIIPLLRKVGPAGTGIGADAKKALAKLGVGIGADDEDAVVRDKLDKYFAMLGLGTPESARSDEGMHQRITANPNAHLVQGANLDLAIAGLAQKRLLQAQFLEAQNPTATSTEPRPVAKGPAQYGAWAPAFNTQQDPRAYVMDQFDPDRRKQILNEVNKQRKSDSPADRAKAQRFLDSYRIARSHAGLIDTSQFAGQ